MTKRQKTILIAAAAIAVVVAVATIPGVVDFYRALPATILGWLS